MSTSGSSRVAVIAVIAPIVAVLGIVLAIYLTETEPPTHMPNPDAAVDAMPPSDRGPDSDGPEE